MINNEETTIDQMLRPQKWNEYIGQEKIKKHLKIMIEATNKRNEAMDHILLAGQAGLGKTTLAYLIAKELGGKIKITSGPALEKMGDVAAILTNLEPKDILFIDEAHRINRLIEEVLYPAMEMRKLHLIIGKGPSARNLTIDLPPFTLIAATTRENLLSHPLRSRFGAIFRLNYYDLNDIITILKRSAKILKIKITNEALNILAKASRATPRLANRLLKRSRDYALVNDTDIITEKEAEKTLELLEIDNLGLEPQDRKILEIIIHKFRGGPVGLKSLAAALNEDQGVIEDIYEPYLISLGFLQRTSAGRIVLPAAYKHLGIHKQGGLIE
ncbi:MAG: Holliday junction branch migration DNA helicase RuvB [Patescibacteria group bacterium]|nr:Holliday junction branch migration DNA helicase RuvB [Patescibacteria group bacterium]MCX7589646.1 Holliday junction branch migration DNA helicase RuvB [Patescibacteria group bacterium]MDW8279626.1 Holliday junction branch migration DNA helicase RuvB [bacterium]